MSRWKQWASPPAGALPGGIVTKAGVVLIAVLVAGLLLSWAAVGPGESAAAPGAPPEAQAVGDGMGRSLEGRIRAETERQAQLAAARARADLERQVVAAEEAARAEAPGAGATPVEIGEAEAELRESLRLEELERWTRSLRSLPVAESHRDPNAATEPSGAGGAGDAAGAALAEAELLGTTLEAALTSLGQSFGTLEDELATEELLLASLGAAAAAGEPGSPEARGRAPGGSVPAGRGTRPAVPSVRPDDPPETERIHEGSFLEAVLVTQLSGDFPGPVLATVSVPFYSADRQRILIPRGTRAVGTAEAVGDRDQSRLAVAFHRLLLPDGSSIDLAFRGLNQTGEGALKDEVERHYLSTFAAAGAVGLVGGLTLAGSAPYGLRSGIGQGVGQSAAGILDRFLNRLPTITIRAGHRLRIWFTSDVLMPRPGTRS